MGVGPIAASVLFGGCAVVFLLSAAGAMLGRWEALRGPTLLVAAAGLAAIAGYCVLWAYFLDASTGTPVTAGVFGGAALINFWGGRRSRAKTLWKDPDWLLPILLMAAAATLYTGLLFMFPAEQPMSELAQVRLGWQFPPDNELPRIFAERLRLEQPLKPFFAEWQSSDRPPLQTGWILLLGWVPSLVGTASSDADHQMAMWFQLLWVPAVWAWMRSMGVRLRTTALVIAAIVPSGFFIFNSVYVWPKLSAAALMIGAFTLWFLGNSGGGTEGEAQGAAASTFREADLPRAVVAGALASLAFLSHGGAAFAFLALVPFLVFRRRTGGILQWIAGGAALFLLLLPWLAYQRFYDPPGTNLIKLHLSGTWSTDDRGTLEVIADAYAEASPGEILNHKLKNVGHLFLGPWRGLLPDGGEDPQIVRRWEFYRTFFALGWWNLGFGALAAAALPSVRRRSHNTELKGLGISLAWVGVTVLVWAGLMFVGGATIIHSGSYTVLMILFPALALALWRLHPLAFGAVAAMQLARVPALWLRPPAGMEGLVLRNDSLLMAIAGLVAAGLVVWLAARLERRAQPGSGAGGPLDAATRTADMSGAQGQNFPAEVHQAGRGLVWFVHPLPH